MIPDREQGLANAAAAEIQDPLADDSLKSLSVLSPQEPAEGSRERRGAGRTQNDQGQFAWKAEYKGYLEHSPLPPQLNQLDPKLQESRRKVRPIAKKNDILLDKLDVNQEAWPIGEIGWQTQETQWTYSGPGQDLRGQLAPAEQRHEAGAMQFEEDEGADGVNARLQGQGKGSRSGKRAPEGWSENSQSSGETAQQIRQQKDAMAEILLPNMDDDLEIENGAGSDQDFEEAMVGNEEVGFWSSKDLAVVAAEDSEAAKKKQARGRTRRISKRVEKQAQVKSPVGRPPKPKGKEVEAGKAMVLEGNGATVVGGAETVNNSTVVEAQEEQGMRAERREPSLAVPAAPLGGVSRRR